MEFYLKIFTVVFLLTTQNAIAQVAENSRSIGFEDLRAIISKNAELTKSMTLARDAARARTDAAEISYLPVVDVFTGVQTLKAPDAKLAHNPFFRGEASLRFYDGGRAQGQIELRSLATEKLLTAQNMQIDEILQKARQIYWQILHHQELLQALNDIIKINNTNRKAAIQRISAGIATSLDKIEFEMKDIDLKREVKISQMQGRNLKRKLTVLLGLNDSENLIMSEPLLHDHQWQEAVKHASADVEYQLKAADFAVSEMDAEAAALAKDSSPEVFGFVDWESKLERNTDDRRSWGQEAHVGVRLSVDLNTKKTISREVHAIKLQAESLRVQRSQLKRDIETDMQNDMDELSLIHTHVHEAEENIQRAENYYKLTQSEYGRGVKNSLDVLSATENLYHMKAKYLELIADFQQIKTRILFRIGR